MCQRHTQSVIESHNHRNFILLQVFYFNKIVSIMNYIHSKSCIWHHFCTSKNKTSHNFWGHSPPDPLLQKSTTKLASFCLCPPFQKSRSAPVSVNCLHNEQFLTRLGPTGIECTSYERGTCVCGTCQCSQLDVSKNFT